MKKNKGISAFELLLLLAIVAFCTRYAWQEYRSHLLVSKINDNVTAIHEFFTLAKQKAVERESKVVVCPSTNGKDCSENFEDGFIAFVDKNNNQKYDEPKAEANYYFDDMMLSFYDLRMDDDIELVINTDKVNMIVFDEAGHLELPEVVGINLCHRSAIEHQKHWRIVKTGLIQPLKTAREC